MTCIATPAGMYWIPAYEILETRGGQVHLVNARRLKPVPGRKTDVKDCQWIQYLHTCGLLRASFRPEAEMCALRAYVRHRAMLLEYRAAHIQPMQKALQQMHVRLSQVLTDITGTTGLAIIRALVAGERDPVHLARLRDPRCAHSGEGIAQALTGHYRAEHVFALQQALALYDVYTAQVRECDAEIARHCHAMTPVWGDLPPLDRRDKALSHSKNAPAYDARSLLYQLTGVDLVAFPGLHASTVQTILAEIGLDMGKWPNAKAFYARLGLAPRHEISGGKVLHRSTLPTHNRAGQALRLAAQAAGRSQSGLGAFYRRMRARLGPQSAIVATAHKIARIIYHLLTHRTSFRDLSPEEYSQRIRAREIAAMRKKA
ncbi:MAG TPA: IS110 family transposase, partial [Candidatus Tectomicrobia bacterium]|nr:IS110 family transposase [Candidatus Tectomicrobia bacterium]